ncbi:hypothetical protein U3516DRAFT_736265 [Neocallimastix sp. 'constans']
MECIIQACIVLILNEVHTYIVVKDKPKLNAPSDIEGLLTIPLFYKIICVSQFAFTAIIRKTKASQAYVY